jgi:peptide deformylase
MALLDILYHPDARLHTVAQPVQTFDDRLRTLIADMLETMYEANGVGLAATQVDFHQRLIVIDASQEQNQPLVLINPELVWQSPQRIKGDEGCLSVPGIYDRVERARAIRVQAQDGYGLTRIIEAEDLLSICIQHEMDHLMGKVFVEYLSTFKQSRIKTKMIKVKRSLQSR